MPDIAMCQGIRKDPGKEERVCPRRGQCYRYTARPSEFRQSYFANAPLKEDDGCDSFLPLHKKAVVDALGDP